MERRWLMSAVAALAVAAAPVLADDRTPEPEKPPAPASQAEPDSGPTVEAGAPAAPPPAAAPVQVAQDTRPMPMQREAESADKEPTPPAPRLTFGGSADFYYSTNFNDPFTGMNALRAFDVVDEHGPHLGLIDIWAQWARDPIGFRIDLDFGPTSHFVNAFEPTDDDIWAHLQQVYVSYNLNRAGTTYVDFGKWVTTAGAEVIEPKDNWLYTRGLLFNLAIPFYHLGFRGYHYFNDTDYVGGAIHRGWNAVSSPGHDPGFALFAGKKLNDQWTVIGNYYGGEEGAVAGEGEKWRNLIDLIALYNPTDSRWAYTFNFDFTQQGGANVWGLSAQAKYALNPKSYLAARGEFLIDDDFVGTDAYSLTLGYTYMFSRYFQTRAEFRYDWAGEDVFADERRGTFTGNQPTFLISAIASFP